MPPRSAAPKTAFVCQQCGNDYPKWIGKCPSCGGWNTLVEERVVAPQKGRSGTARAPRQPIALDQVPPDAEVRIPTGIGEFDRVLGGGIVRGSLVLLGGDPGIGKSSLLMQASASLSARGTVLYVSGEESAAQVKLRARRFGIDGGNILLLGETDLASVVEAIRRTKPLFCVIDSIQTMSSEDIASAAGGVSQLRECTARLLEVAKGDDVPIFLVGHVTKEGNVAGPRVLEHIVDAVLYLEGERFHAFRVLRATKNRFGSTDEVGVFEMGESGLREVMNPSEVFLEERSRGVAGSVVVPTIEGTRPLLVEVQALVTPTTFGLPRRTVNGMDPQRIALLLAVLTKRAGLASRGAVEGGGAPRIRAGDRPGGERLRPRRHEARGDRRRDAPRCPRPLGHIRPVSGRILPRMIDLARQDIRVGGHIVIGRAQASPQHERKERAKQWSSSDSAERWSASSSVSSSPRSCSKSVRSRRSAIKSSSSFSWPWRARSSVGSAHRTRRSCPWHGSSDGSARRLPAISRRASSVVVSDSSSRSFSRSRCRSFRAS